LLKQYGMISTVVSYTYIYNSIKLNVAIFANKDFTIENCRKEINRFHQYSTNIVFPPDREKAIYATVESWFSHNGFQKLSRPKDLGKNIAHLITLVFIVHESGGPETFRCSMPFVGGDISVTSKEPKTKK